MADHESVRLIPTHWGTFAATIRSGRIAEIAPAPGTSSRFWDDIQTTFDSELRIRNPAVRKSFLENSSGTGRGAEPFVEVSWECALDLAAGHLARVRHEAGNEAIFGGSYGWASTGRFHHAQSQVHRFLNAAGGYTRSVGSYSCGAAEVILPHVIGGLDGLTKGENSWGSIGEATELIVAMGGISRKNAQSNAGGLSFHHFDNTLHLLGDGEIEVVSVSPVRDDSPSQFRWLPIAPTTDVPFMLGIAHVLVIEELVDRTFLERCTVGYEIFEPYLLGHRDGVPKSPEWASGICGIEASEIRRLARLMASKRTMIMMSWSLQRAENGEQPYWLAITLAAMLGQIGLPGGGFGFGYGSLNSVGHAAMPFKLPSLPQLKNPVRSFIPVARVADMLLNPGASYRYNGQTLTYPDIKLVYWVGGNPFHHHQDLNRLRKAWAKPEVVIVNDAWWTASARHADIVFPSTLQFERNDIVCSAGDLSIVAAKKLVECPVNAWTDYDIFSALAARLCCAPVFTENRSEEDWVRLLYQEARSNARSPDITLPEFDAFWRDGRLDIPKQPDQPPLLAAFRNDPAGKPLPTPSGKIEIFSSGISRFGIPDNPGHPVWMEPSEWRGAPIARTYRLHLLSNQPSTKLHSQFDFSPHSRAKKIRDREPVRIHPIDAGKRAIRQHDIVRVFNSRGAFLAAAVLTEDVSEGVLQIATGAWYDPAPEGKPFPLDKHGNPNVVTHDRGTSEIAQACSANSCLVEVETATLPVPEVTCYAPPVIITASSPNEDSQ